MQVTIYSHNYAVTGHNRYGYEFLKRFGVDNFGEKDFRAIRLNRLPSRFRKKPLPTIKKTYASYTSDGREFRFHINTLDMFKAAVAKDDVLRDSVTYVVEPMYTPSKIDLSVLPHWVPREQQPHFINYFASPGSTKILNLTTGGGKALKHGTPVLTPTGWVAIESLNIGDEVLTPSGCVARVTGVYPQGEVPLYSVALSDGREVPACGEHLWSVQIGRLSRPRVVKTLDIIQLLKKDTVKLPLVKKYNGYTKEPLPIAPYVVGYLYAASYIGNLRARILYINPPPDAERSELFGAYIRYYNGVLTPQVITPSQPYSLAVQCARPDLPNDVARFTETVGRVVELMRDKLPIPMDWMNGDEYSRQKMLDGLLDGLLIRGKNNDDVWSITVPHVRDCVLYLAHSLGYRVTEVKRGTKYTINKSRDSVNISNVRSAGRDFATCISIDHPDRLFITKDFVVTHNTFCSLAGAATYNERLCVTIESRFFHLWEEALSSKSSKQVLNLKDSEIMWVQGSRDLKALLELAMMGKLDDIKVIIVALRTMANYIETYQRFGKDMLTLYPVLPIDFYKTVDVGTALKDEVHLSLYANFVEELFSHVPRRFSLSATLEDGTFKDTVFGIMFPMEERFNTGPPKQYIEVNALMYRLKDASKVNYSVRGSSDYNHNAYEKWLLSNRGVLNNYLKFILEWLDVRYLRVTQFENQKAVIFVSSVEMVTEVFNYLKKNVPHRTFGRYAASSGDDYEEAKLADVLITTEKSFSTGFDLPGLMCVLLTTAINSKNTNIQILGRLRELRDHPEVTPIFDYLVCEDIKKHVDYHEEKKTSVFKGRVKSHKTKYTNRVF